MGAIAFSGHTPYGTERGRVCLEQLEGKVMEMRSLRSDEVKVGPFRVGLNPIRLVSLEKNIFTPFELFILYWGMAN